MFSVKYTDNNVFEQWQGPCWRPGLASLTRINSACAVRYWHIHTLTLLSTYILIFTDDNYYPHMFSYSQSDNRDDSNLLSYGKRGEIYQKWTPFSNHQCNWAVYYPVRRGIAEAVLTRYIYSKSLDYSKKLGNRIMTSINIIAHIYQPELRHSANVRLDLKIIISKNIQMQEQTSKWKWWLYGSVRFIVENEKQCHFRIEHCQNIYLGFPVPW